MLLFECAQGLYPITTYECVLLSELIYGHLACTLGPIGDRSTTWPPEQRHIIHHILQRAFLHPSVAGAAVFFITRLKQKRPEMQLAGLEGLNVFTASFMVASKYLSDYPLPTKRWLYITGYHFSPPQLSYLETKLCGDLDWDFSLDPNVLDNFDRLVSSWTTARQHAFPVDFFCQPVFQDTRPVGFEKLCGVPQQVNEVDLFPPLSSWHPSLSKLVLNLDDGGEFQLLDVGRPSGFAKWVFLKSRTVGNKWIPVSPTSSAIFLPEPACGVVHQAPEGDLNGLGQLQTIDDNPATVRKVHS